MPRRPKTSPKPSIQSSPAKGKPRAPGAAALQRSTPPPPDRTRRQAEAARQVFERFATYNPSPKGELEYVNVYTLLIAVVLSAQATDAGVNKATRRLFALADTPEKMLAIGEDCVREMIKTIGLFRNKAKNVIALSERLILEHGGDVPADRDALERLPGVGRKTANVVMNMAFGHATIAVDTHVFRVSHRIGLSKGNNPLAVEADLERIVPADYRLHAHHWLILHGRYVCKARRPECWRCVIRDLCPFPDKSIAPASKSTDS